MPSVKIKDYEEWLKNNKMSGTSGTGSSGTSTPTAYDELKNRSLYQQYVDEAAARNTMRDQEALVDKQTASALRDNYVAQEQAKRQANEAMLASGVQTGLSESSLIDLYARGAQARAGIINSSNTAKKDIFSKYQDAIATSKRETNSSLAQIETERDANAKASFGSLLSSYGQEGGINDFETVKSAYNNVETSLDSASDADLISLYKEKLEENKKAENLVKLRKEFESTTGILLKDDTVNSIAAIEDVDSEFFGFSDKDFRKLRSSVEKAVKNEEISSGELVVIQMPGLKGSKNLFYYKDGYFYKTPLWFNNQMSGVNKATKMLTFTGETVRHK